MAKAVLTTKEGLTITVEGTAVSKAIMAFGNIAPTATGRQFKVTNELRRFESHQPPLPEVLRMVVPKALIFITELGEQPAWQARH